MPPRREPEDPLRGAFDRAREAYSAAPHRFRTWAIGAVVAVGIVAFMGYEYVRIEGEAARLFSNAVYLLSDGQYPAAEQNLGHLLRQYRLSSIVRSREANFFAGTAAFALKRYPAAAEHFRIYLDAWGKGPLDADAAFGFASALEAQGKAAEAEKAYREALEAFADSARASDIRMGLARTLEAAGRREEAVALYREVETDTAAFLAGVARTRLRTLSEGG